MVILALVDGSSAIQNLTVRINDMESFKALWGNAVAANLGMDYFKGTSRIIDYEISEIVMGS